MYDESEFVMNTNKKPMGGGVSCTFFACRAKEPDVGSQVRQVYLVVSVYILTTTKFSFQVSIKIVKQPISYVRPQSVTDYFEEQLWQVSDH